MQLLFFIHILFYRIVCYRRMIQNQRFASYLLSCYAFKSKIYEKNSFSCKKKKMLVTIWNKIEFIREKQIIHGNKSKLCLTLCYYFIQMSLIRFSLYASSTGTKKKLKHAEFIKNLHIMNLLFIKNVDQVA